MQMKVYVILMAILLVLATVINADDAKSDVNNVDDVKSDVPSTDASLAERRAFIRKLFEQRALYQKRTRQVRRVHCYGLGICLTKK